VVGYCQQMMMYSPVAVFDISTNDITTSGVFLACNSDNSIDVSVRDVSLPFTKSLLNPL